MGRIAGVTAEETRARLLDAAAKVFEAKGYEGATVAQIAREAGVTTGAIYAHFRSKADLLVAALRTHSERAVGALLTAEGAADAATVLAVLAARLPARPDEDTALLSEALLASRRDAELAQVLAGALREREGRMARLLGEAQGRGEVTDEVSVDVAARFTLMLGLGALFVRALDLPAPDPDDWDAFIHRIIAAFTEETAP